MFQGVIVSGFFADHVGACDAQARARSARRAGSSASRSTDVVDLRSASSRDAASRKRSKRSISVKKRALRGSSGRARRRESSGSIGGDQAVAGVVRWPCRWRGAM